MSIISNLTLYENGEFVPRVPLLWNESKGSFHLVTASVLYRCGGYEGIGSTAYNPSPELDEVGFPTSQSKTTSIISHYSSLYRGHNYADMSSVDYIEIEGIGYTEDGSVGLEPDSVIETLGGQGIPLSMYYRFIFRDGTIEVARRATYDYKSHNWKVNLTNEEKFKGAYIEFALYGTDNPAYFTGGYHIGVEFPGYGNSLAFPPVNLDDNETKSDNKLSEVRMLKMSDATMYIINGAVSYSNGGYRPEDLLSSFSSRTIGIARERGDIPTYDTIERTYLYGALKSGTNVHPIIYAGYNHSHTNDYYDLEEWFNNGGSSGVQHKSDFINKCPHSTGFCPYGNEQNIRYTVGGLFKTDIRIDTVRDIEINAILGSGTEDYDIDTETGNIHTTNVKELFQDRYGKWYYYFEADLEQSSGNGELRTISLPLITYKGNSDNLELNYLSSFITIR